MWSGASFSHLPAGMSGNNMSQDQREPEEDENADADDFNPALPTEHAYLGNLEALHGYTLLDEDTDYELVALCVDTLVLPGHTLPLVLYYSEERAIFQQCIETQQPFVLALTKYDNVVSVLSCGVVMQIVEYKELEQSLHIKAKGRQRCAILGADTQMLRDRILRDRTMRVRVRVRPDIVLGPPMAGMRLPRLRKPNRLQHPTGGRDSAKDLAVRRYEAVQAAWPVWVYDMYEVTKIHASIRDLLTDSELASNMPSDPLSLSYWILQNFIFSEREKVSLLKIDNVLYRLQLEADLLSVRLTAEQRMLCCRNCSQVIGKEEDVFPMSREGMQSSYCNPGGHVYEIVTVSKAKGVRLTGMTSTEFSWFPGYSWTVLQCKHCTVHLGWLFKSANMRPSKFYGLTSNSVATKAVNTHLL